MNLPTVTVKAGEFGPAGYMPDLDDGTYALVREADGQTVTAERRWFCGFADATIVRGDSFEYRRNRCLGDHDSDDRGGRKWVCGWVLLVRGADMEETT